MTVKKSSSKSLRRRVDGWLILDKPQNLTSTAALGAAKRLLAAEKGGHSGTLDPLATGVLPLAFGQATKTVPWVQGGEKTYQFTVRWGVETDTDDAKGKVLRESDLRPSPQAIAEALPAFRGAVRQVPPRFSALKLGGVRAYDLARSGETPDLPERTVSVLAFDLLEALPDQAAFRVRCGSGTYVRALARDLGRALDCLGHVVKLRRTAVGSFGEADAIGLEQLAELSDRDAAEEALLPVAAGLASLPSLVLDGNSAKRLVRGQAVELGSTGCREVRKGLEAEGLEGLEGLEDGTEIAVFTNGTGGGTDAHLLAIAQPAQGLLKPLKLFALPK